MRASLFKLFAVAALLLVSQCSQGAFDAFLKIEGVEGKATDKGHDKWIEIESFSHGAAFGSATTRASFSDFCFLKAVDRSSPILIQKCAQGTQFPSARLELITVDADRLKFYEITLSNVVVSSVSTSGATGGAVRPTESVCLNFAWIGWTYTEFDVSGTRLRDINSWWDLVLNRGGSGTMMALRVGGVQIDQNNFDLSWTSTAGKTYKVHGSDVVTGPFSVIQTITVSADGQQSLTVPISGAKKFFFLEETP
jgi:type VI secretion system secreted protein Hcp